MSVWKLKRPFTYTQPDQTCNNIDIGEGTWAMLKCIFSGIWFVLWVSSELVTISVMWFSTTVNIYRTVNLDLHVIMKPPNKYLPHFSRPVPDVKQCEAIYCCHSSNRRTDIVRAEWLGVVLHTFNPITWKTGKCISDFKPVRTT